MIEAPNNNARRSKFVGLLRGINVGGHNKIPMSDLRSLCAEMEWEEVQSYIQSGNLVFSAAETTARLEVQLEDSIERHFGLQIPVIVRDAEKWLGYVNSNPFPEASLNEPNRVILALSKRSPDSDAVERLRDRADKGECLAQTGEVLWIYFRGGSARSKLSPTLLGRFIGSPVTTRNWRTVLRLDELAGSRSGPGQIALG